MHTVGALDLGGSSLEVTFVPAPGAPIVDIRDSRARSVGRPNRVTHVLWVGCIAMQLIRVFT